MEQAPDQEDPVRFAWLARALGKFMAAYIALVARTIRVSGPPINQGQVIFAVWHETNLAAATAAWKLRDDKHPVVFSTRGFRGIVMNSMLRAFGSQAVTLPPEGAGTRREAAAVTRTMARLARGGASMVISCDGPFGPYRVAKPGVVIVARECGLPIQPWAIATRPPWRLKGRWDRMIVPMPFGRMRVFQGELVGVGGRDRLKPRLAELQAELQRVQALADR
jgi:3-deoxy-D-manno-octulosonic-acid transferase